MEKRALVTGASEGIGNTFARRLAQDGFIVTAVARNESKLKELIKQLGEKHRYLVADLSTDAGQRAIAKEVENQHYNLLINNAGVGVQGQFAESSIDKQLAMVRLNCEAVVVLSHSFLNQAKKGDALVNVSSALAFNPFPNMGLYAATKAFVTSFSESLWYEQKERGVFVMDFCPGITSTNFQVSAGGKMEDLPKNLAQTPETVVDNALKALAHRQRPTVVSGVKNLIFASMFRVMPRKSLVKMMGKMAEGRK